MITAAPPAAATAGRGGLLPTTTSAKIQQLEAVSNARHDKLSSAWVIYLLLVVVCVVCSGDGGGAAAVTPGVNSSRKLLLLLLLLFFSLLWVELRGEEKKREKAVKSELEDFLVRSSLDFSTDSSPSSAVCLGLSPTSWWAHISGRAENRIQGIETFFDPGVNPFLLLLLPSVRERGRE